MATIPPRIALLHKPWGCLTQFTDDDGRPTLAELFPHPGYYPAGRLDRDSEGLVLLTCDGALQHRIAHPRHKLVKVYHVQVEGQRGLSAPSEEALQALRDGVMLRDGPTLPAAVRALPDLDVPPRDPPIRTRREIPTHWLEIAIHEGRNRQVRRMTAAAGLPTLRLIRVAIGPWRLAGLERGRWCWAEDDSMAADCLDTAQHGQRDANTRATKRKGKPRTPARPRPTPPESRRTPRT